MIGLADCNNFYASCERVFNPKIKDKPVVVLSNNDGCVIARSNEAKALNIKMGQPAFKIKSILQKHKVHIFSTNFALYGDLSERVMNTLKSEINKVEVYSIDEAFLDFSDFSSFDRAMSIRKKVKQWTGIPISIGIAPTKTLAKVANHIAKKSTKEGVFVLRERDITRSLQHLAVEDIWGVGRRSAFKLKQYGVYTALDFTNVNTEWLRRKFSINAVRLQKELKGERCYELELKKAKKKNICTSRSFGKETNNYNIIRQAVSNFANTCAVKLRNERSCCSKISVFLMTNRYKASAVQHFPHITLSFNTPTSDSFEIVSKANIALQTIYNNACIYKKAGVIVQSIVSKNEVQASLFDTIDRKKRNRLMCSIDKINMLMGRDKIRLAAQGFDRKWKLKQEKLSPCYTTRFSDILSVNI